MSRAIILFGAGASLEAGLPTTGSITHDLFQRQDLYRHSDSLFYFGATPDESNRSKAEVYRVRVLLRLLASYVDSYNRFHPNRTANYEDLYYLADQLEKHIDGSIGNPAIEEFSETVLARVGPLLKKDRVIDQTTKLLELLGETCSFIESIVYMATAQAPKSTEYLRSPLGEVLSGTAYPLDIYTLNHDVVIETFLRACGLPYYDGFSRLAEFSDHFQQPRPVKVWDPDFCSADHDPPLRFFKLHGSVDWHYNGQVWFKLMDEANYHDVVFDRLGGHQVAIGTHNKYLFYSWSIFSDLQVLFRRSLAQATRIVVAGFSFGDAPIKNSLLHWLDGDEHRRMMIIDPHEDSLREQIHLFRLQQFDQWVKQGRIRSLTNSLGKTSPDALIEFLR